MAVPAPNDNGGEPSPVRTFLFADAACHDLGTGLRIHYHCAVDGVR